VTLGNNNGTDGQTDRRTDRQRRQTDRVRRNMRPPPREEGRIINRWGQSGQVIDQTAWFRAPRINVPFLTQVFHPCDDVKLAELSNSSFE